MIHTDGIQTIANAEVVVHPDRLQKEGPDMSTGDMIHIVDDARPEFTLCGLKRDPDVEYDGDEVGIDCIVCEDLWEAL